MAEENGCTYQLSVKQAAEIRRRLSDTRAETVTLEEFNEHVRRRLSRGNSKPDS